MQSVQTSIFSISSVGLSVLLCTRTVKLKFESIGFCAAVAIRDFPRIFCLGGVKFYRGGVLVTRQLQYFFKKIFMSFKNLCDRPR